MHIPANMIRLTNAALMLSQRRRRWSNIEAALVKRVVFAVCMLPISESTVKCTVKAQLKSARIKKTLKIIMYLIC